MVTTVVTTVTTTTVTSIAAMGFTSIMGIAGVVLLILLLVAKELAGAGHSQSFRLSSRFLNVGIIPLVMVFAVIVAVKIAEFF